VEISFLQILRQRSKQGSISSWVWPTAKKFRRICMERRIVYLRPFQDYQNTIIKNLFNYTSNARRQRRYWFWISRQQLSICRYMTSGRFSVYLEMMSSSKLAVKLLPWGHWKASTQPCVRLPVVHSLFEQLWQKDEPRQVHCILNECDALFWTFSWFAPMEMVLLPFLPVTILNKHLRSRISTINQQYHAI
jgi:hypothetical protein